MAVPALMAFPSYPAASSGGGPPLFVPLVDTEIGQVYRGDTIILPIWEARDFYAYAPEPGTLLDLNGATLWFTAKTDLAHGDGAPQVIQHTTGDGGIVLIEPTLGLFQVTIDASKTQSLEDDTAFIYDVQVRTALPAPRTVTVKRGTLTVIRDVTRATG